MWNLSKTSRAFFSPRIFFFKLHLLALKINKYEKHLENAVFICSQGSCLPAVQRHPLGCLDPMPALPGRSCEGRRLFLCPEFPLPQPWKWEFNVQMAKYDQGCRDYSGLAAEIIFSFYFREDMSSVTFRLAITVYAWYTAPKRGALKDW